MIISHKHKFVFFHPPKCAGSSLQIALEEFCEEEDIVTPMPPRPDVDDTKFSRDWNDWNYDQEKGHNQHASPAEIEIPEGYRTITVVRNPWSLFCSFYHWYGLNTISFRESMDSPVFKWDLNAFWNYPHSHIIRFEHLEEDFKRVCKALELDYSVVEKKYGGLPRLKTKKTPRDGHKYTEHYDNTTKEYIATKYAKVIKNFEYKYGE